MLHAIRKYKENKTPPTASTQGHVSRTKIGIEINDLEITPIHTEGTHRPPGRAGCLEKQVSGKNSGFMKLLPLK